MGSTATGRLSPTDHRRLTDFFDPVIAEHGDRPALRWRQGYRHQAVSFRALGHAVHTAAHRFCAAGVQPGDRVLLAGPSSPEWVTAFFGILLAGGVVVPLDENTQPDFVSEVRRRTDACVQVAPAGFPAAERTPLSLESFHPIDLGLSLPFEAPQRPDELLEIVYTSGTTSRPKGVLLTHGNVIADVAALHQAMAWPSGSRFLSVLPLSHMLGQVLGLFVPLRFGGTVFFAGTRRPSVLRDCFRRERITVLVTVPAFLDRIRHQVLTRAAQEGRATRLEQALRLARHLPRVVRRRLWRSLRQQVFPDLEHVFVGGAALRPDTEDFFAALGIHVLQGYGMTEAAPIITCNTVTAHRAHTVGRALPGIDVQVSPEGEILARGPNVTSGYLDDGAATGQLLADGWLHTGDLGTADADGYWRILGRQKDVLIGPSGMNVYPEDVERVLNSLAGVRDSCVVGQEQGERLRLIGCVLPEPGAAWNARALLAEANGRLASHQRLQAIERWPHADLPRGRTLKVKRDEVLAGLQNAGCVAVPADVRAEDQLLALLHECLDIPAAQTIADGQRLTADLGLDSLGRLDLLSRLEERCGVELPEAAIDDRTTVADLRQRIAERPTTAYRLPFPSWARRPRWVAVRALLGLAWRPLFRCYLPLTCRSPEHLDGLAGPVIFIANHASHLDTPAILAALPAERRQRVAVAAAADHWFAPGAGWLARLPGTLAAVLWHAFPFSRTDAVEPSLRYLGELIDEGWSILLYPEGTRSPTGQMAPFKSGIGLIACAMQVPVVPIAIQGCFASLPKGRRLPRPAPISVAFGRPWLPPFRGTPEAVAEEFQQGMRAMMGL